ncbi:T3SS effector HopA1 family protein [Micromonospora sp. NPDC050187]|uniref:T3SS effector HopA1 family protein n=1 Tax=Micromonospora sp. NPDC050187 TaxID=3364277 RepID=UPI0037B2E3A3
MSAYHHQLASVLAAVRVHSPTSYSWLGHRQVVLPTAAARLLAAGVVRAHLVRALQTRLYQDFYTSGGPAPVDEHMYGARPCAATASFRTALAAANSGTGAREPGWQVYAVEHDRVVVERDGLRLWLAPGEVCPPSGGRPTPGGPVAIRMPRELASWSTGFYVALGDLGLAPATEEPVLRLYWNLRPDGGPRLLAAATARLNRAGVPFRLKVASDPALYHRCDAGVLYLPRRRYRAVAGMLTELHGELRDTLDPYTPSFTRRLAPGLALAEDPQDGGSFGLHRCGLLAEGVLRAYEHGAWTVADRVAVVADCFRAAGIHVDRPYLDPGSTDDYPSWEAGSTVGAGSP